MSGGFRAGAAGLRRRPHLAAALILALMAVVFVGQGLLPGRTLSNADSFWFKAPWLASKPASLTRPSNPEFDDAPAVLHPFTRYAKDNLPDVPLWNPHIMAGRPFEADAQSAIFSPFSLPAYLLPFMTALGWIAVLKLWAAAFGTYLLGRALGMRFAGALLAGVAYGFSLWMVTWLSYPHASVWALIPWMMVAADRALRRPDVRGAAPLAVVTGLQFLCGHPESSFHAVVATTIFAALRLYRAGPWRRPAVAYAGALALGGALAAVMIVPFTELLLRSADLDQRAGAADDSHSPVKFALGAFLPDWYGRPTQTPLQLFLLARAWYGGALTLMLAAAALILRPTRGRLVTAGLGLGCMMVVLGVPPVFDVVVHLPLFSSGHNGRLAILALLCLALLAGWGLDDLLARVGTARRRSLALGAAAALFALPLVYAVVRGRTSWGALDDGLRIAWGFATPNARAANLEDAIHAGTLWTWLVVGGAGFALVAATMRPRPSRAFVAMTALRRPELLGTIVSGRPSRALAAEVMRRRPHSTLLAALAIALVFGDLARAGMGYNPAIPRSVASQPDTPAIRLLRSANPARFVAVGDIPQDALPMNHGLYEARGYDLPIEKRFDSFWRRTLSPEFPSQVGPYPQNIPLSLPKLDRRRLELLGVLGTRFVIQPPGDPLLRVAGLRLVHDGPDARVYRNLLEQPRAAVVGGQAVVGSAEAARRTVSAPGFRFDRLAVTEHAQPGLPNCGAACPAAGTARITKLRPDRLELSATARRAGMLVVSDNWDPGWHATVDGREEKVERVDHVFRGVRVGPGTHHVVMTYRPLSWRIGWIASLTALAVLLGALGLAWRRGP